MNELNLYRGVVVSNEDPLLSCRVRVRIPGLFESDDLEEYPWATYITPFSGIKDSGSYCVPEIGEYVFILEFSEEEYYWFGSWNSEEDKPLEGDMTTKKVVYKSTTGHTILMDDTLEKEKLQLIDRAGQVFEFLCALKQDAGPRGIGTVTTGNHKTIDALVDHAQIRIKDIAGSEWVMQSKDGENKFYLTHADGNKIEVTSDAVIISTQHGSRIEMNDTEVVLEAASGVSMTFNLSSGDVTLDTSGSVHIKGAEVKFNDGTGGIHSSKNYPNDYFTGTPLSGSSTEKVN